MELVTHRRWAKKTILDALEKWWRKEHGAGKERHRRRFLKIQWSKKAPQEVTFKLRCEKCWGDDSESLLLPGPGSAFFLHLHRLWVLPYLSSEEDILSSDLVGKTEWAALSVTFKTFTFVIVWSPHLCILTRKRLHTLLHLETTSFIHHQEEHPLLSTFTPLPFWKQRLVNKTLDREHWGTWPRVRASSASKDFPSSI